jgi:hypothetical protein
LLISTGVYNLCITESIQAQLDLSCIERRKGKLENGSTVEYYIVGSVVLKFKNRQTVCSALILKGNNEALLSASPLKEDVLIHPLMQALIVMPDYPYYA